jgi:hypothetical protein
MNVIKDMQTSWLWKSLGRSYMFTDTQKLDKITLQQAVLLIPWNRVFLGKLVGPYLAWKFMHFVEPECSLLYSREFLPPLILFLSPMHCDHAPPLCLFEIHFNITLLSMSRVSKQYLSYRFCTQNFICISLLCMLHVLLIEPSVIWSRSSWTCLSAFLSRLLLPHSSLLFFFLEVKTVHHNGHCLDHH